MQCAKLKTYMETGRVVFLPARSIRPNPAQPRQSFDEKALAELTDSVRRHGVIQPLSVRRTVAGYELIAGERRLRAAQAAGLSEIPCIVMSMDDAESGMAALVENLQRQDLDFLEEAMGISRLIRTQSLSQEQAARMLGKSQSAIANKLRLLRHSPEVLSAIKRANLSERHARALLRQEERAGENERHWSHQLPGHERQPGGAVHRKASESGSEKPGETGESWGISEQSEPESRQDPGLRDLRRIRAPGNGKGDRGNDYNSKIELL